MMMVLTKLFPQDDINWELPKLKVPERREPISKSLADFITIACTKPCQISEILDKYQEPSNCESMCAPYVNEEIWANLVKYRKVQTTDRSFRDIQNLVTLGMLPILKLCKILKLFSSKLGRPWPSG
jgi:hypothetical protein